MHIFTKRFRPLLFLFLLVLFAAIWIPEIRYRSEMSRLTSDLPESAAFRSQPLTVEQAKILRGTLKPGEQIGIYWLESDFGQAACNIALQDADQLRQRWELQTSWSGYIAACRAIWDDLEYFPVAACAGDPAITVTFENSWMYGRSYKGERGHEGTDIIPTVSERGRYPVVSMTDGVVKQKGWLELGGWRIGIEAPLGGYFYYAHLDSYTDLEVGDHVSAGQVIGFMGDTGYSHQEGTTGNFPVHLHLGVYIHVGGKEISVNPYPALVYIENRKISADF